MPRWKTQHDRIFCSLLDFTAVKLLLCYRVIALLSLWPCFWLLYKPETESEILHWTWLPSELISWSFWLIFSLLAEVPICAKVVDDFDECSKLFYKGIEPQGMDQNSRKICQQYENNGNLYASLYSTLHKIPVYSTYTFDPTCSNHDGEKSGFWFIEPQVKRLSFWGCVEG